MQSMVSVNLTVDGRAVSVPAGSTVLDAVKAAGLDIPHLCKDEDQAPLGACRTCLVQIEGQRGFPASCYLPVRDGMAVSTTGEELDRVRATVLDLTLAMLEPAGRGAALLSWDARRFGATARFEPRPDRRRDESTPAFTLDLADCILCQRCVEGCQDVQHIGAIAVIGSGEEAHIGTFMDEPLIDSICTSCGTCVSVCPTGALYPRQAAHHGGRHAR